MTIRHYCPVKACGWYHEEPAAEPSPTIPPQRVPGEALEALKIRYFTVEMIVDAHLTGSHTRVELAQEINRERARADAATANYNSLYGALKAASDFARQMDALRTMRMPSRAEVEAVQARLVAAAAEVSADVEA
jgi:hypothetical protein